MSPATINGAIQRLRCSQNSRRMSVPMTLAGDCWTVVVVGGATAAVVASGVFTRHLLHRGQAPAFSRRTDRPPKGSEAHPKELTPPGCGPRRTSQHAQTLPVRRTA